MSAELTPPDTVIVHMSVRGRAACDGRELSRDLTSTDYEAEGGAWPCALCQILQAHQIREGGK